MHWPWQGRAAREFFHVGDNLRNRPLIYPIIFKSTVFAIILICFHIEEALVGVLHGKTFSELYAKIRRAVMIDGLSRREAAKRFGAHGPACSRLIGPQVADCSMISAILFRRGFCEDPPPIKIDSRHKGNRANTAERGPNPTCKLQNLAHYFYSYVFLLAVVIAFLRCWTVKRRIYVSPHWSEYPSAQVIYSDLLSQSRHYI
jgi:hypothetical protein